MTIYEKIKAIKIMVEFLEDLAADFDGMEITSKELEIDIDVIFEKLKRITAYED